MIQLRQMNESVSSEITVSPEDLVAVAAVERLPLRVGQQVCLQVGPLQTGRKKIGAVIETLTNKT